MAGGALGRLNVLLGLDSTEFTRGLNRSEYQAKKTLDNFERQAKRAATAFVAIGAVAATGFAVMTKRAIDSMDSMSKMAQQAGTTTETLSALTYAADLSGVSQEKLVQSLARLSQSMADAAAGTGEAKDAFAALGVSVTNSDGSLRSSDAVFTQVAQRLSEMENGSRKTALAMDIFGRSGAQLIPMLNSGEEGLEQMRREAEQLGIVMDTDAARAAERLNDEINRLTKALDGLFIKVASDVVPVILDVFDAFKDTKEQTSLLFNETQKLSKDSDIENWAQNTALVFAHVYDAVSAVVDMVMIAGSSVSAVVADSKAALATMANVLPDWGIPGLMAKSIGIDTSDEGTKRIVDEARQARERVNQQLSALWNKPLLTDVLRDRFNNDEQVPTLGTNVVTAPIGSSDTSKAQKPTDPLGDFMRDINIDYAMKEYQQYLNFIEDITGRADQKLIEQQQKWLDSALETGRITVDEYGKAMDQLVERTKQGTDQMDQFAVQAARNIESSIGDTMYQVFKGNFDNIGASFSDMLARMAADLASSQLSRLLLGNFGSTGSVGGLIGNIFGGLFGGLFGGGRASGGPVDRGMFYEVNENGPELLTTGGKNYLMMGNQSGHVTPRIPASPQVSGGNSNITTNVYISDSGTRTETSGAERQGRQLAQMIEAQVRSVVANERRQGGVLWNMANGRG